MMRINDLPRPWLLAAMTGVPMSALLEQAERERTEQLSAEQAREAWQRLRERYRRELRLRQQTGKRIEPVRLAS